RVLRAAAAVTIALCLFSAPAEGHAALRDSDPANGASLAQAPAAVTLVFTEEPEPGLSLIRVLDAQGRQVQRGAAQVVPGNPFALRQPLERIGRGAFTVTWRTVSRVDGHLTSGTIVFGIGVVPSSMPESGPQQPAANPVTAAGRWFLYLGLVLLLGAAWVWAFALPQYIPPTPWVYAASTLATVGIAGIAAGQRDAAGVSWGQFFGTFLGYATVYRALPVAAATAAFAFANRSGRYRRAALIAAAAFVAVAMLVHVYAGHAGAGGGMARWIRVMLQWIHLGGVGVWLGGLAALLLGLRGTMDAEKGAAARRYSNGAAVGLAAVVLTGVLRAVDAVGAWASLWSMLYGRLVLTKVVLLVILAGLGAVNRYRNVPAVLARLRALRTIGAAELALAIAVLAITGVLTGLAPPRVLRDVPPSTSLTATGSDFASSIRVRIEVTPGRPGLNRFTLRVVDFDTGRPAQADEVQLRLTPDDRPEIATSSLPLTKVADGTFGGQGSGLSLAGPWNVVVNVRRGADVLRVPLRIAIRDLQTVRAVTAPGQPTLYYIDLVNGTQLQLYLLPAGPGPATVHMTFFDARGLELSIPESPTVTVIPEGSEPVSFTVRRLSPGHFLADGRLPDRPVELQILAVSAGGEFIRAGLTVRSP
ncbi:MAG: copper resistance protein CopC, partial [bacterium]